MSSSSSTCQSECATKILESTKVEPHIADNGGTDVSTGEVAKMEIAKERDDTFKTSEINADTGVQSGKRKASQTSEKSQPDDAGIKKAKLETKKPLRKVKRQGGFTDEQFNETSYYVENNLRKVYPYYFTFTTFTKGRWVGEKIMDVFAKEFRAHPPEEYERCINSGSVTINSAKINKDYRLKHNDQLANTVHRHEVPVTSNPIEIIHMDEDFVVINKPASIPVHPCGRYRHNTVVFILAKEHQLRNLRTIHRLDRLTSGLLILCRNPEKAKELEQQIRNRLVAKTYVCRVEGNFPDEEVECSEPIDVVSFKIGVCKVSKDGKECTTVFTKLSSNGKTSVILAKPRTGRMHQIRVHLQYLGYPIVNDPLYNHPVFGPEKGKGGITGKTDEQLIQELITIHNAENWLGSEGDDGGGGMFISNGGSSSSQPPPPSSLGVPRTESDAVVGGDVLSCTKETQQESDAGGECISSTITSVSTPSCSTDAVAGELPAFKSDLVSYDPHCSECKVRFRDPKPKDLVMYLHALSYKGEGWSFETKMPVWAAPDWVEPSGDR